ncbi:hypothetical protein P152DRAFT_457403 [Eremomyces bilateralis CBS 781.70]|uniref:Ribosomal small subunit assembly protein n=1 Tax=Eremomyces bilateralis CBS 781.70 TaxID=1392243 RepID=A0A6G1G7Q9_9PEZI|nr:uncharacterized protein P152DRAFT_457403 [Eremomyces bilateralis CBS 781.70]KAF1814042.1 hypothetical protein P152DRAFT_457403 [Eremomyces bilateralis CBS 781.70]
MASDNRGALYERAGYTILPITFPPTPAYPHKVHHHLYLRSHDPRIEDRDTPRTLFVSNVPIDASESSIRDLFKRIAGGRGAVQRVEFEDKAWKQRHEVSEAPVHAGVKRKREEVEEAELEAKMETAQLPEVWEDELLPGGTCALVVFADKSSKDVALKASGRLAKAIWKGGKDAPELTWNSSQACGIERYLSHHHLTHPTKHHLQSSINTYLTTFTRLESLRTRLAARTHNVPDADGFVTVTRHAHHHRPASSAAAQAAADRAAEKEKKIGPDFYRFQAREKRKERDRELKVGFEEDVRRIREMRERRGRVRPE